MISCPSCSRENPDNLPFCQGCWEPLKKRFTSGQGTSKPGSAKEDTSKRAPLAPRTTPSAWCEGCGKPTTHAENFCTHCGKSTSLEQKKSRPVNDEAQHKPWAQLHKTEKGTERGVAAEMHRSKHHPSRTTSRTAITPTARLMAMKRDGSFGDSVDLTTDPFDIGRTASTLSFQDDLFLSDTHCRLQRRGSLWILVDLNSENGVYLRIKQPSKLQQGDALSFGKQVFFFDYLSETEAQPFAVGNKGIVTYGGPHIPAWGRLRQFAVSGIWRDIYHLYLPQVICGREFGNITFPDDEFMSRQHLAIGFSAGQAILRDLGSRNGTFLKITEEIELRSGDLLKVGDQLLRFDEY